MNKVWLVVSESMVKDDVVSIWTTKEMAEAAVRVHQMNHPHRAYRVKEWTLNVSYPQWD